MFSNRKLNRYRKGRLLENNCITDTIINRALERLVIVMLYD